MNEVSVSSLKLTKVAGEGLWEVLVEFRSMRLFQTRAQPEVTQFQVALEKGKTKEDLDDAIKGENNEKWKCTAHTHFIYI